MTVLVNGKPQRLDGDVATEEEGDAPADGGEAPVFQGEFDLVSGDDGELELDSDVEDGGAAPWRCVLRLALFSDARPRAQRAASSRTTAKTSWRRKTTTQPSPPAAWHGAFHPQMRVKAELFVLTLNLTYWTFPQG